MTRAFWLCTTLVAFSVATAFSWDHEPAGFDTVAKAAPASSTVSVVAQASDLGDMF